MPAIEYFIATRCSDLAPPSVMWAPSIILRQQERKIFSTQNKNSRPIQTCPTSSKNRFFKTTG